MTASDLCPVPVVRRARPRHALLSHSNFPGAEGGTEPIRGPFWLRFDDHPVWAIILSLPQSGLTAR